MILTAGYCTGQRPVVIQLLVNIHDCKQSKLLQKLTQGMQVQTPHLPVGFSRTSFCRESRPRDQRTAVIRFSQRG